MKISIPGSKSDTNRALILAALSSGVTKLKGASASEDSEVLVNALKKLGLKIQKKDPYWICQRIKEKSKGRITIDVKGAGTAMRFLTAFCASQEGEYILGGNERMQERPIGPLVEALIQLGAEIEYLKNPGFPPLKISGKKLPGGSIKISGSLSSQYISALLLVASNFEKGLQLKIVDDLVSKSYLNMTLESLNHFNISYEKRSLKNYFVPAQTIEGQRTINIEADASGATYFWALAALTKKKIRIPISPNSKQGDVQFPKILQKMGCIIRQNTHEGWIEVEGTKELKSPGALDMTLMPDTAQTLAVLAAVAKGTTRITGLSTLKHKETDRIAALILELKKLGVQASGGSDFIEIKGTKKLHPASIKTYDDHRMAMSFAILSSLIPNLIIENPEVVQKSFPEFWDLLKKTGVNTKTSQPIHAISLHGFRASGKSSLGQLLAKKLNWEHLEMDEWIEKRAGKKIHELTKNGQTWGRFRKLESEVLEELLKKKEVVISTGGGLCVNQISGKKNLKKIQIPGMLSIVLDAKPEDIVKWVREDEEKHSHVKRPILDSKKAKEMSLKKSGEKDISMLLEDALIQYKERKPLYQKISPYHLNMSELSPKECIEKIRKWLEKDTMKLCCVIGDPIDHSRSPELHNKLYKSLGISNQFHFFAARVEAKNLATCLKLLKQKKIIGISCTIPHKEKIISFLDEIDPIAQKIGAVNTVIFKNGKQFGTNTDWLGILNPLKKRSDLKKKQVAIVGAGGVARAAAYAIHQAGGEIHIFNRNLEAAKKLAQDFKGKAHSLDELAQIKGMDIVIQASSVGMNSDESLIPKSYFRKNQTVMDCVYTPLWTRCLLDAKEAGAKVITGDELFLEQAKAQFEYFTGLTVDFDLLRSCW